MALHPKAVDDICRLCAIESQSGVIIYSAEGENLCLEEKIINCLRIEVSRDDLLPKKVCQLCNELLQDYHRFTERAVQVQQTLSLLLGLHNTHVPFDEMELCLMQTSVKTESNLIKNELDDLLIQQGPIQLDAGKFDISSRALLKSNSPNDLIREKMIIENIEGHDILMEKDSTNVSNCNGESNSFYLSSESSKQMGHRRKMLQPKKANISTDVEAEEAEAEAFVLDCSESQTEYKCENIEKYDLFQDEDGNETEENDMEKEWSRRWGIMCDRCENVFPNKVLFDKHYALYYNKQPFYTCSYCKKSVEKYSAYRSHCFSHIYAGRFKCNFCDEKFGTKEMLEFHAHLVHESPSGSFVCGKCGAVFPTERKLILHREKHSAPAKKEFPCSDCGKILQTRGGLTAHMTVHRLGRRFMCHLCGKTFTQKINMQQHVKHHKGERPYSCPDCGKSFAEKSHLNRHKSFHTLDRPFQCPICLKMYKTERCLKVHSHVHLSTRPYVCSFCGKGFLSSTKLKQHYNCHTGERPYACKYCERTFTNYPNWLKHTRRRHKVDHKTGLSLKEETENARRSAKKSSLSNRIELIRIEGASSMKSDGDRDAVLCESSDDHRSVQLLSLTDETSANGISHLDAHSIPDLLNSMPFIEIT